MSEHLHVPRHPRFKVIVATMVLVFIVMVILDLVFIVMVGHLGLGLRPIYRWRGPTTLPPPPDEALNTKRRLGDK